MSRLSYLFPVNIYTSIFLLLRILRNQKQISWGVFPWQGPAVYPESSQGASEMAHYRAATMLCDTGYPLHTATNECLKQ